MDAIRTYLNDTVNLKKAAREVRHIIKTQGWKIGAFVAVVEFADHVLLPAVALYFFGPVQAAIWLAVPVSEIAIWPAMAVIFGRKLF